MANEDSRLSVMEEYVDLYKSITEKVIDHVHDEVEFTDHVAGAIAGIGSSLAVLMAMIKKEDSESFLASFNATLSKDVERKRELIDLLSIAAGKDSLVN